MLFSVPLLFSAYFIALIDIDALLRQDGFDFLGITDEGSSTESAQLHCDQGWVKGEE
jgi:hypothetical protein